MSAIQTVLFVIQTLAVLKGAWCSVRWENIRCAVDSQQALPEGKVEDIGRFPWFGVLQHTFYLGGKTRFAVTNGVLVHPSYVIASAEDVARIQPRALTNNTRFIVWQRASLKYSLEIDAYYLPPEYTEGDTLASLALLHIMTYGPESSRAPVPPVCLPIKGSGAFTELYALKMTDETGEIGKEVVKMNFMENQECEEFYYTHKLNHKLMSPVNPICAVAESQLEPCVWDGGIALITRQSWGYWKLVVESRCFLCNSNGQTRPVSYQPRTENRREVAACRCVSHRKANNHTGYYVITAAHDLNKRLPNFKIGFSVRGPGCGAPTRFLYVHDYLFWIDQIISQVPLTVREEDQAFIFRRVSPIKLIMYSAKVRQPKDQGMCDRKERGNVLYKDNSEILVSKNFAQGFFFMSMAQVAQVNCASVSLDVASRTNAAVWIEHHCHRDLTGDRRGQKFRDFRPFDCFVYFKSVAYIEFRFYFSFRAMLEVTLYGTEEVPKFIPNPYHLTESTYPWLPTYVKLRKEYYMPIYCWWWSM